MWVLLVARAPKGPPLDSTMGCVSFSDRYTGLACAASSNPNCFPCSSIALHASRGFQKFQMQVIDSLLFLKHGRQRWFVPHFSYSLPQDHFLPCPSSHSSLAYISAREHLSIFALIFFVLSLKGQDGSPTLPTEVSQVTPMQISAG